MDQAEIIFLSVKIWAGIGAIIAAAFLTIGIDRIDEDAEGAYVFRLLLVPGILLIWPLVLWRWYVLETGRDNWKKRHEPIRNIHFRVAIFFAIAIPVIMAISLAQKQKWPSDFTPQKLSEQTGQAQ